MKNKILYTTVIGLSLIFAMPTYAGGASSAPWLTISGNTMNGTVSTRYDTTDSGKSYLLAEKFSGNNTSNVPFNSYIKIRGRNKAGTTWSCQVDYSFATEQSVWSHYEDLTIAMDDGTYVNVSKDANGKCTGLYWEKGSHLVH